MPSEIPLDANVPFQSLSVELGDNTLLIELFYVTRFALFRVNIYDITSGQVALVLGRTANLYTDLLRHVDGGYGSLSVFGEQPTLSNLGITSKLIWGI